MKKFALSLAAAMCALWGMAQTVVYTGSYTNDVDHTIFSAARIEMVFNDDVKDGSMRLIILPEEGSPVSSALVDTIWGMESYYRFAPAEKNEMFEEKDITFLYALNPDGSLRDYIIFDQLVDNRHPAFNQTVIRKCDADGNRIWCAAFKPGPDDTKFFFKTLKSTIKRLKFKQLKFVKEKTKDFEDNGGREPRINNPHSGIGRGSSYGSGTTR